MGLLGLFIYRRLKRSGLLLRRGRTPDGYDVLVNGEGDRKVDQPRDISTVGLGLSLKSGQVVLINVNHTFRAGTITAVMGPSGSGKTTLLTTLAGRQRLGDVTAVGETLINGRRARLGRYKRTMGFVPQDDIMYRDQTVREALLFSALTRQDRKRSTAECVALVDETIVQLGLLDVAHSIIGGDGGPERGISGGQRKRVNLGLEMVSSPSVM